MRLSKLAAVLALPLVSAAAMAHDDATWIQQGGFKDIAGKSCCGPADCHKDLAATFVEPWGWRLEDGFFVPDDQTTPISPDGYVWVCRVAKGSPPKCVFTPPKSAGLPGGKTHAWAR